jgi:methyl-accepting chemotaxis protein
VDTVTEFNDLSLRTQDSVQLIRSSVMEVLGQAQFQDIARQQIEQVQKGLALFSQRMEALSGTLVEGLTEPLDIAPLVELTKIMDNNYTMLPQRKTHNATIGGKPTDDEESLPRIQLF